MVGCSSLCLLISKSTGESLTRLGEMSKQQTWALERGETVLGLLIGLMSATETFISMLIAMHLFLFRYVTVLLLGGWLNNGIAQGLI